MCARLVAELGAGAPLFFDPSDLTRVAKASHSPLLRALELIVFNFCVGEALSIPMLRSSWKLADEPLIKAVLGQIVRDEAAHGQFGFMVLEWAKEETSDGDRAYLSEVASQAVAQLRKTWQALAETPVSSTRTRLGWMEKTSYLALADQSLERAVVVPLAKYGIYVS